MFEALESPDPRSLRRVAIEGIGLRLEPVADTLVFILYCEEKLLKLKLDGRPDRVLVAFHVVSNAQCAV